MNIQQLMKQAQAMQTKMTQMQEELAEMNVEGQSGGGMVKVTMNGKGELASIKIDPSLMKVEDQEMLEDLIVAATNDARHKLDAEVARKTGEAMGGMGLPPGMKLPF